MHEGSLFSILLTTFVTCKLFDDSHSDKRGFPGSSAGKESAGNAGDLDSISGSGRSPGEGNSYPLLYSGLENSMGCTVRINENLGIIFLNINIERSILII